MADVPAQWIDRLFDRFTAIFGAQKVAGMWAGAPVALVKQTWAEQLGRIDPDAVRLGLQRCVDDGLAWPPTLPEFVALCRRPAPIAMHQPALLPAAASRETGREQLDLALKMFGGRYGASDPLAWARRPATPAAVRLMVAGAAENPRLGDLLMNHFASDGCACRSRAAREALLRARDAFDAREGIVLERTPGEDDEP